jgi:methionyl-tRNA synthetase
MTGLDKVLNPAIFFTPLDQKAADEFKLKFSGNQKERKEKEEKKEKVFDPISYFNENVELKVAEIIKIENNPESDKLYVETLDDGSGTPRIIQSGLREYLKPEDLLGKKIILAANLAPRKMRGIESHGMLLACDYKDSDGKDCVEVLEAPWAEPGTKIILEGQKNSETKPEKIQADNFFKIPIKIENHEVKINSINLTADGKKLTTKITKESDVN